MDRRDTTVLPKNTQNITTRPGVYLFYDNEENVIYVGKAKNLKKRVRQYFSCHDAIGSKTSLLVSNIANIKTIPTDSEFDAILLESKLIRTYLPKYNAIARDDKSPLYVCITFDEPLPRILFTRGRTIESWKPPAKRRFLAGPFPSGRVARLLMRSVRHIVPYCTQKRRDGIPCFYTHIGLCHPCPSTIKQENSGAARIYRNNLQRIALLLSGQARAVRTQLERAMLTCAKRMEFEKAGEYKRQLDALDMLVARGFDPGVFADRTDERIAHLARVLHLSTLERIECVDISSIQGQWATGSLVVFTDGVPDADQYRRFRVKMHGKPNDAAMMAEVITRRFAHPEWPHPNLLVVDGGKPQVMAALHALAVIPSEAEGSLSHVPVIGLAKRFEQIIVAHGKTFTVIRLPMTSPALQLLQHIRDEAHRFAKRYHLHLRKLGLFATIGSS